jgi:hypothetical protein
MWELDLNVRLHLGCKQLVCNELLHEGQKQSARARNTFDATA